LPARCCLLRPVPVASGDHVAGTSEPLFNSGMTTTRVVALTPAVGRTCSPMIIPNDHAEILRLPVGLIWCLPRIRASAARAHTGDVAIRLAAAAITTRTDQSNCD